MSFSIHGIYVAATAREIVERLRNECGGSYFNDIVSTGSNVQTNCPFHKNGTERKPSFGVSDNGVCHCFTCGTSCSVSYLVWYVLGVKGSKWLLENFVSYDVNKRGEIDLDFSRGKKVDKAVDLDYHFVYHPYLESRHISKDTAERFEVSYDVDSESIAFVVRSFSGKPLGKVYRSIRSKQFFIPSGFTKPVVYADRFNGGMYTTCYVCESIFNALTCWQYGLPAVALLGTGDEEQYKILNKMPVRKFVLALDPDEAGEKGRAKLREALSDKYLVTELVMPDSRDINDLDKEVINLKEIF